MTAHLNVVLTGFMGTGKTQVGRRLAKALGREFVDIDELIEGRAGTTIPEVFACQGEKAFRQLEHEACLEVGKNEELVVATGGGTVINPDNLRALQEYGILICLTASAEEILKRVGTESHRPMLESDFHTRQERIKILMEERAPYYNAIRHQVDTTHLSHCGVVSQLKNLVLPLLKKT